MILDLSANNVHPVTWPQVKAASIQGVILKATQGTNYVNPDYAGDLAGALSVGLPVIAYHFAGWTTPAAEARFFVSVAGARARVLDSETNVTATWQNAFLAALGLPGTEELDYGSASTLPSGAVRSLIWAAAYGPMPADGEVLWQFTSSAHVPGITGTVDASEWLGTQAQFDAVFGIADPPGGTDMPPGATDVVDTWVPPGATPEQVHADLMGDGGLKCAGVTIGALSYTAVANDGCRYTFGPGITSGPGHTPPVYSYPGLPATARQGSRYFVRMVVFAYAGEPISSVGTPGPQGPPGPAGPPGSPADVQPILARLTAAAKALAG